ncbi:MAG TPA: hypothetical protein VIK61_12500 [Acidimicrobiia bacterium]
MKKLVIGAVIAAVVVLLVRTVCKPGRGMCARCGCSPAKCGCADSAQTDVREAV